MRVISAAAPPFMKNGFVIACGSSRDAVLIDPGDEVDALLAAVAQHQLAVSAILLTHAHLDHINGVGAAKSALGAPIWLHRDDRFLYDGIVEQARMFGLQAEPQPPVDRFYDLSSSSAATLRFGSCVVDVRHTPGHCPGGVCLAIGEAVSEARELFVGDTLFAGSIGRVDLPGGDHETLLRSIRTVLFTYPDETIVHSGHGPDTTIGDERRTNPFLVVPPVEWA
jgi:glyoxylase-like metal-dependent hydrolase (beta-lactamase superfamily II)